MNLNSKCFRWSFVFSARGIQFNSHIEYSEHDAKCDNLRWTAGWFLALCVHGDRDERSDRWPVRTVCYVHHPVVCAIELVRNVLQVS